MEPKFGELYCVNSRNKFYLGVQTLNGEKQLLEVSEYVVDNDNSDVLDIYSTSPAINVRENPLEESSIESVGEIDFSAKRGLVGKINELAGVFEQGRQVFTSMLYGLPVYLVLPEGFGEKYNLSFQP